MPLFTIIVDALPDIDPMFKNINENRNKWENIANEEESEKQEN